jgi:hypothetical protein
LSKVLDATCSGGVVLVDGLPVEATILSEGVSQSSGVALIEERKVIYVAKTSGDLKDLIDMLSTCLTNIASVLTSLDTPSPPSSNTVLISQITACSSELSAMKESLK